MAQRQNHDPALQHGPDRRAGAAQEKIKADSGRWNKTLATLRQEQEEKVLGEATPLTVPREKIA